MSNVDFNLTAETRRDMGKGASRRLRRADKVPAVLYGAGKEPTPITVDHNELFHHLEHEAFYSHVLTLTVDGKPESAVLKDLQRHPVKPIITHADFQRVSASDRIRMHVPLHFKGGDVAPGVKIGGGMVTHNQTEVEVLCLPKHLPEFIEVDMSNLELGQTIHMSDLKLPEGVTLVQLMHGPEHDLPVAAVAATRGGAAAAEEAAAAGGETAA